jgi:leucyl/phenylalanyl-tRNA--protein transferase
MHRSMRRFQVTYDTAFEEVVRACGDPRRPNGWITPAVRRAYVELHELGWGHSVEVRSADGELVGGLYGLQIGGLFAGESMFHRATDASKVALVALVDRLCAAGSPGQRLLDVQWTTPHLKSLGAVEVPRPTYLQSLADTLLLAPAL